MLRLPEKSSARTFAFLVFLVLAGLQLGGCGSREQRAQNYYDRGMSYVEKNDFVKARIEIRNALQINGNMIEAWRALAQMDEKDRNWQALAGNLRKIIELDPKDVSAKLRLGRLLLLGGGFDQALKLVNEVSDQDPKNASVLALKAAVLFKLKDADGAIRAAEKAVEIDPDSTESGVVLAAAKFMQGDTKGALSAIQKVKDKDDFGVIFLQINIFNRLGDTAQVEKLLLRLVELNPKEEQFRTQLVRFYTAHNRPDEAEKALRSVAAANPADANAELNLVAFLAQQKSVTAARDELNARIAAGGNVFPFQLALAKLDFAQGKFDDGAKLLETLIAGSASSDDVMTARITLAQMYMGRNNVAAAEPLVTAILKADSRNISGLMLRASIHTSRDQNDDAIADLRAALNDQPQSPELLSNLATTYERSGSIELADKAFADATKASRYAPAVGLSYVEFLRRRNLAAHAENVVADLASRNPNSIPVLSTLAQIKLAHQDWAAAHAIADAIHRLDGKSDISDQINGAAFSGEKKFSESLAMLQNAYDANPGSGQTLAALVNGYLQAKQVDQAEAFLQSALKANPANADALVLMGSIAITKGNLAAGIANFEGAIKQQPKNAVGYRNLADLYTRQKKYDEALKVTRSGLEQLPQDFSLQMSAAGLLELKGDIEGAIAGYEAMLKQQPGSMIVANNLASLLVDFRTDKASLDRANSLALILTKSQIPQFKDTLGWIAYRRNDYNNAVSLLEGAGAELPNNALVRYHLGMSYLATGQDAKASEQLKKARELAPNDPALKIKIDAADKSLSAKSKG